MRFWVAVAVVLLAFGATRWAAQRPVVHAAGTLVAGEPLQTSPSDDASFEFEGFELTPLADLTLVASFETRNAARLEGE